VFWMPEWLKEILGLSDEQKRSSEAFQTAMIEVRKGQKHLESAAQNITTLSGEYSLGLTPTPTPQPPAPTPQPMPQQPPPPPVRPRPPQASSPEDIERASTVLLSSTEQISGGLLIVINQLSTIVEALDWAHKNLRRNTALTLTLLIAFGVNVFCVVYMLIYMSRVTVDLRETQIQLTELVKASQEAKEGIDDIKEERSQNPMGIVETQDGDMAIRVLVPVEETKRKKQR
jgi:hypothetical protein